MRITYAQTLALDGLRDNTTEFTADISEIFLVGTRTPALNADVNYDAIVASGSKTTAQIAPVNLDYSSDNLVITSLTPGVATVAGDTISHVSDGTAVLSIKQDNRAAVRYEIDMVSDSGNTFNEITGYVAGTLGEHVYNNCLALTAGFDPTNWLHSAVYSQHSGIDVSQTQTLVWLSGTAYSVDDIRILESSLIVYRCVADHLSGVFTDDLTAGKWVVEGTGVPSYDFSATRNNINFVAANGLAHTGVSAAVGSITGIPRAFSVQSFKPGTLISPRHLIGAAHFHATIGQTYTFMREDGTTVQAKVLDRIDIPTLVVDGTKAIDVVVTYLDIDLQAAGFPVYKMMPSGWENLYAPSFSAEVGDTLTIGSLPCVRYARHMIDSAMPTTGQRTSWMITAISKFGGLTTTKFHTLKSSVLAGMAQWSHQRGNPAGLLEGGDSGCPMFLPINFGEGIELVYLGAGQQPHGQTSAASFLPEINEAMNIMAARNGDVTQYAVVEADLSAFTSYS